MMRRKIGVIVALVVVAAWLLARAQTAPSLQGVWRVAEIAVTGANASSNTSPQPGLFMFTRQHYSIVTVNGTAPRKDPGTPKDPAKLTDAEKMARYAVWDPFTANSGTYKVSGSTITTQPVVAKNPSVMMGQGQTREFKIEGNTLTLIQKSPAGQPVSETRTKLTRVE
jgi:lipocalin-like protein